MPQLDRLPKTHILFIENLLFHRARKVYFWMVSFLGKLTITPGLLAATIIYCCREVSIRTVYKSSIRR